MIKKQYILNLLIKKLLLVIIYVSKKIVFICFILIFYPLPAYSYLDPEQADYIAALVALCRCRCFYKKK